MVDGRIWRCFLSKWGKRTRERIIPRRFCMGHGVKGGLLVRHILHFNIKQSKMYIFQLIVMILL